MDSSRENLSRRAFIRVAAGGGLSLSLLAAACQPAPNTPTAGPTTSVPAAAATVAGAKPAAARSNVPTYLPAQGPKADYPSTDKGVENGYVKFPSPLSKSVAETPAAGGDISGMVLVANPSLPAPVE